VSGSKEAILNTQTAFEHLFQRPDATEFSLDANRTSLSGMGGTIRFGKSGGKSGKLGQVFKFETGVTVRSPGLEINDIGFLLTTNEINHFTWAGLHFNKSFSIFRSARFNYNHWSRWDYSGKFLFQLFNINSNVNFKNNWQAGTGITYNPFEISNNALRGASALRKPIGMGQNLNIGSDSRKKVYANIFANYFIGFEHTVKGNGIGMFVLFQPLDALSISFNASYSYYWRRQDQFADNISYANTIRSIVSEVEQKTLRFVARINYNITPDLTIQYYGQPFITRPIYKNYAYVSNPLAKQFNDRFHVFTPNQISYNNGEYFVDENTDGNTDYSFGKPDFNFVQFRSNLIIRWEYRRGSELYLVWNQGNTADAFDDLSTPIFKSLFDNAFADQSRNIFLMKWTYRFLK
jgi:hypothetical protein